MKVFFGSLLIMLLSMPVMAQDAQTRLNTRIGTQIGELVLQNDNLAVQVEMLQGQLASAQQRVKDMEAKAAEASKLIENHEEK